MNNTTILGLILIFIGGAMLAWPGFSYTKEKKILDIGSIEATTKERETVHIPPVLGWIVTGTGAVVLVMGLRRK